MAQKKGRNSTCITKKTKLNETKPIEVVYTSKESKVMNIVRVQNAQRTEITPTQLRYNINVAVATLH